MELKNQIGILAGFCIMLTCACNAPAHAPVEEAIDMEKLKMEIQAMEDAFSAAEKAKDADAVAAYYSDDAISYGRDIEPTTGKTAIRDRIAERMAKDSSGISNVYKVVDLFAEGNMAVEIGSWVELDSTGAEVNKGHYMSYFEKRDGKYLCVRDMNVQSAPNKPKM